MTTHCVRCEVLIEHAGNTDRRGAGPFCWSCYQERLLELSSKSFREAEQWEAIYKPQLDAKDAELARLRASNAELLAACQRAKRYIINGIECGYITPPDPETDDPAHETLPAIEAAIKHATEAPP
jgi:hypothetical protein